MKGDNPHAGHRARLRARAEREGLASLAPHEMLEWLLYGLIPRRDVNADAHALLERGGDIRGALTREAALPLGEKCARYLEAYGACAEQYRACAGRDRPLFTAELALALLRGRQAGMYVAALDGGGRLLSLLPARGGEDWAQDVAGQIHDLLLQDASVAVLIRCGSRCTRSDREGARNMRQALRGADMTLTALLSAVRDEIVTEDLG